MGLSFSRLLQGSLVLALLGGTTVFAAPKLRLSTAAIGPLSVATGQNGPQRTVEAFNAGDGALNLAVSSPDSWLEPAAGAPRPCSSGQGNCIPINIALQTATLERGVHTGTVMVADPEAVDAPQTITVTVQMGGGVPDEVDLIVPPNGSDSVDFETNNQLSFNVSTESGGDWLSLALTGGGSFGFVFPYRITARHINFLPEGVYNGSVNITGSGFGPDVKNVAVRMRVTTSPIGALSARTLAFRLTADLPPSEQFIAVSNRGLGSLSINEATTAVEGDGDWLSAELLPDSSLIKATANPEGLEPGEYEGTLTIQTNAVNSPHTVAVSLTVLAAGPPVINYRGVVNNATFNFFGDDEAVSNGGIAAVFGEQLSLGPLEVVEPGDWPTQLGVIRVLVNGEPAPIHSTSFNQINIVMPFEIQPGEAIVQVERDGQLSNQVSVPVVSAAPRTLRILPSNYGIYTLADGTVVGIPARPVRRGETIVIWSLGYGQTVPPLATGEAAGATLANVEPRPVVTLGGGLTGGLKLTPDFAGRSPGWVGLYQVNLFIPGNAPIGMEVPLTVEFGGQTDIASIAIE